MIEKNAKQLSKNEGVSLPKIPFWWKAELEKSGCEVKVYDDITEDADTDIMQVSLDKCLLFLRYNDHYRSKPTWQVVWDVEAKLDSEQRFELEQEKSTYPSYYDDEGGIPWHSGESCRDLTEVQRSINEWIWCVKHYNKVRRTLLDDLFLKEFQVAGCTMRVYPFPTEPHESYNLADVSYGDTHISVSFDTSDQRWHFGGGVRRCSFNDPSGMIKSLHKRARRFLKEDY